MTESFERQPRTFGEGIDDLVARLGRVEVDDAVDDEQARDAAREVLDLGIRLLDEPEPASGELLARGVAGRLVAPLTTMPVTSSMLLSRDTVARRAFVLGGPRAVAAREG